MMSNSEIIIIGAGAAGLMAAKILSENNITVCILEARNRIGGRVYTINKTGFSKPVEAGAEFIHGKLPLTMALLKEAGIKYYKVDGELWQIKNGELKKQEDFIEHSNLLVKKLKKLDEDISVGDFLKNNFAENKYREMARSLQQYIEGYDAADITNTSSFALKEDWENEDDAQYRIKDGYGTLLDHIKSNCLQNGCSIYLSNIVKEIRWTAQRAEAITNEKKSFTAKKVIITVPIVLLAETSLASISFTPALPEIKNAARHTGYGGVIKIVLEFTYAFWKTEKEGKAKDLFFIFSREKIPAWWSQLPDKIPILTGWLAGPKAKELSNEPDEIILQYAMDSLAHMFAVDVKFLQQLIKASYIHNWISDPFSRGAYSYKSLTTEAAKKILLQPVSNTLFFAGEALSKNYYATVEAALQSGKEVGENILKLY
ncbi:MAG: NAD(P)/FAD-dependent oxidoreductase [Ginsengibacter sp.]